ncbi:protein of unknown function [Candidatus Methylocalor cossyra]|uniref:Uncharacterized protein n=1 Tax=Candidatus Methylocalor cossyra TaxID=3108543 RepID=A0ABM9NKZ0_9GAMM
MSSPLLACFFRMEKIRSCLRVRATPSISRDSAISISSETGLRLRSVKFIGIKMELGEGTSSQVSIQGLRPPGVGRWESGRERRKLGRWRSDGTYLNTARRGPSSRTRDGPGESSCARCPLKDWR